MENVHLVEEKRGIAPVLKLMEVNDVEYFPIIQRMTIFNTINRLKLEGKVISKFSVKNETDRVVVTRIA